MIAGPDATPHAKLGTPVFARFGKVMLQSLPATLSDLVSFLARDAAEFQEMVEIAFTDRFAFLDQPVKFRLRERGFITLVMAEPPVTVHVDESVALEFLAEIHRQPDTVRDGFGVFAIDVENGRAEHFGDARGIDRRTRLDRRGGETNLVVDQHVNRPADG